MEEDWLVSLYLYGMHLHNLKQKLKIKKEVLTHLTNTQLGKLLKWRLQRKISHGFKKNQAQIYIPNNLAIAFPIVALQTPALAGGDQGDHVIFLPTI